MSEKLEGNAEQQALDHLGRYASDASGYASIQGTRPQTLGYGLGLIASSVFVVG